MIEFYKDNLVPPELCRLLYQVAPKKYHVPVRFHNRRKKDVHGYRGRLPLGTLNTKHGKEPLHIDINLNPIYGSLGWRKVDSPEPIAPSSAIWRLLLEVCLHEFGHVATNQAALKMNYHEYHAKYGHGRVYKFTEQLADDWRDRQIERILRIDSRLGQPLYITGYFGARLLRWREWAKDWPGCYPYIMERRCQRTGGQLTTGDVLRRLSINPRSYTNAYALLRRASEGLGIDYVDRAGRRHKLYRWGAVPLLAQRFDRSELRKSKRGKRGEHERYDVSAGYHPGEIEVQKRAGVRSMAERAEEIPKGGLVMAGSVQSIFHAPEGGAKMQSVQAATALEGCRSSRARDVDGSLVMRFLLFLFSSSYRQQRQAPRPPKSKSPLE